MITKSKVICKKEESNPLFTEKEIFMKNSLADEISHTLFCFVLLHFPFLFYIIITEKFKIMKSFENKIQHKHWPQTQPKSKATNVSIPNSSTGQNENEGVLHEPK